MRQLVESATLTLGAVGAIVIAWLQSCTTRGTVLDADQRPIAGADVVLFDETGPVLATTTGADGRYWFVHRSRTRQGRQLAICATGMLPHADSATSALVSTRFGLSRWPFGSDATWWPKALRTRRDLPTTCRPPTS